MTFQPKVTVFVKLPESVTPSATFELVTAGAVLSVMMYSLLPDARFV